MSGRCLTFPNLCLLLLATLVPCGHSAVLRCDSTNRDPCTKFPSLCTEGGGLCVIKGPCEYECVCPPDGRRGRDCSQNDPAAEPPKDTDTSSNDGVSHVESLLVFPKDLFLDINHVDKPLELMRRTSPRPLPDAFSKVSRPTTRLEDEQNSLSQTSEGQNSVEENRKRHQDNAAENTLTSPTPTETKKTLDMERTDSSLVGAGTSPKPSLPVVSPRTFVDDLSPESKGLVPIKGNPTESQTSIREMPSEDASNQRGPVIGEKFNISIPELNLANDEADKDMPATGNEPKRISQTPQTSAFSISQIPGQSSLAAMTPKTNRNKHISVTSETTLSDISVEPSVKSTTPSPNQSKAQDATSSSSQNGVTQTGSEKTINFDNSQTTPERFPGHELFPTFFRGNIHNSDRSANEKSNAALSLVVQRVYHRPERFPVFRRNRQ